MALSEVGALALEQGDLDRAQEAFEEGLELLAQEARKTSEARLYLLTCLGWVALSREEHGQATQLFEESLEHSREKMDTWGLAVSIMDLATVSHNRGDSGRATELFEVSMDLFREQGNNKPSLSALTIWEWWCTPKAI